MKTHSTWSSKPRFHFIVFSVLIASSLLHMASCTSLDASHAVPHRAQPRRDSLEVRRLRPIRRHALDQDVGTLHAREDVVDDSYGDGNIVAMTKFVKQLKEMNEKWQQEAMDDLKEGKTPQESPEISSLLDGKLNELEDQSASDDGDSNDETDDYNPSHSSETKSTDQSSDDYSTPTLTKTQPKKAQKSDTESYSPPQQSKTSSKPKQESQPSPTPKAKEEPQKSQDNDSKKTQGSGGNDGDSDNSGGDGGFKFKGDMTYFDTGLNACGWVDTDNQFIVAASEELWNTFGSMSNGNPICNRKVRIHHNGKTAVARVTDQCPPCSKYSLDMSPSLFAYFEDPDVGRCGVEWEWA